MRHAIWEYQKGRYIEKLNSTNLRNKIVSGLAVIFIACGFWSCGVYSFSGVSTSATNIQVDAFYNNTDLAPANFGQTFTNRVKDYYQRNIGFKIFYYCQ